MLGSSCLHAQQWTKQDSLKLRKLLDGDGELMLNPDAVNSIRFESSPLGKPMISTDSPVLKFNEELPELPFDRNELRKVLTLRPYSAFTKRSEDPIYDKMRAERGREITMRVTSVKIYDSFRLGNATVNGILGRKPNAVRPEKGFNYAGAAIGGLDLMAPFTKKFWQRKVKATSWRTY